MAYPKDISPETQGEGLERSRAFVLVLQLSTAYPQPAETHHDRIMNRTGAVVTRVCQWTQPGPTEGSAANLPNFKGKKLSSKPVR